MKKIRISMKTGDVLEFDQATDYLTELLSKCDGSVLAACICVAATARNTTGTPTEPCLYADGMDNQQVRLRT